MARSRSASCSAPIRNFGSERISLMRAQSDDSVWIGFPGGGLSVYRNDAFHEWLQSAASEQGTVYDVYVENPNLIWLAADNGLYALRGKTVTSWKAKNGLPGNRVLWLQPDGNDWFWLGFSTGIARVRRSDLNESERAGRKVACDFLISRMACWPIPSDDPKPRQVRIRNTGSG